ncbi:hypothetical protein F5X68DRAFT_211737 [Plectosphaerella plurivora]|uniref:F-box domain-containing protein n=1 Tax=Plectosphaerella plurivora TaxID=936078 RepID=A0A9P9A8G6_9PEZI|nr:hypothetical protein F5X68DRAFT_211737 [Plectosphaerella plurivora]
MSLSLLASPWTTDRRSSAAFDIPPADKAAITKLISFPRRDFIDANISFPRKHHDKVRSSLLGPFEKEPSADLGALAKLPLELLGQILLHHVDIGSVIAFRKINRRARHVTDSLHEYKAVTIHGLDFLCALLRTGFASHDEKTLASVHTLLCEKSCSVCGHFAGFVSLLYWTRCCFTCLQFSPELRVLLISPAFYQPGRTPAQLEGLTYQLRSLPGRYTTSATGFWGPIRHYLSAYHLVDNTLEARTLGRPLPEAKSMCQHMAACALPFLEKQSGEIEAGVACAGCQLALSKDLQSDNFTQRAHDVAERMYTKDGLLEHFRWCRWAQVLWKSSGGGQFTPPEMPLVAKMEKLYAQ